MIDQSTIYWVTRMDAVCVFLEALAIACAFAACIVLVVAVIFPVASGDKSAAEPSIRTARKWACFLALGVLVFGVARVATPTTHELAAILVIPKIANSEVLQKEAGDLYDLAKQWLSEQAESRRFPDE